MTTVDADWLLGGGAARANARLTLEGGVIAAVADGGGGTGALAPPALANAHDHARVCRASQAGGVGAALEASLPYLALIPAVDPWLAPAVAFGRAARGGAGAVMAHYTRVQVLAIMRPRRGRWRGPRATSASGSALRSTCATSIGWCITARPRCWRGCRPPPPSCAAVRRAGGAGRGGGG